MIIPLDVALLSLVMFSYRDSLGVDLVYVSMFVALAVYCRMSFQRVCIYPAVGMNVPISLRSSGRFPNE